MLAAVTDRNDRFGGLEGYLQKVTGNPRGVPTGRPTFAGAKNEPTAPVPTPQIKSSAATPGFKSNSVIPYTRVTPQNSRYLAARPGHLSFVSATGSYPLKRAGVVNPERRSLCFSLAAVNKLLTPDGSSDDARRTYAFNPALAPHAATPASAAENKNVLDAWRTVPMLAEWRLDGVMLGVETEESSSEVLNVAVGGICRQVVNCFGTKQFFALEELFVGLVATIDEAKHWYHFEYVPFSGSFLEASAGLTPQFPQSTTHPLFARGPGRATDGVTPRADAPAVERLVGAWRLGRVTDLAAVKFDDQERHEHNLSAHIAIEWLDWRALLKKYPGCAVGADHLNLRLPSALVANRWCYVIFNWPSEDPTKQPIERTGPGADEECAPLLDPSVLAQKISDAIARYKAQLAEREAEAAALEPAAAEPDASDDDKKKYFEASLDVAELRLRVKLLETADERARKRAELKAAVASGGDKKTVLQELAAIGRKLAALRIECGFNEYLVSDLSGLTQQEQKEVKTIRKRDFETAAQELDQFFKVEQGYFPNADGTKLKRRPLLKGAVATLLLPAAFDPKNLSPEDLVQAVERYEYFEEEFGTELRKASIRKVYNYLTHMETVPNRTGASLDAVIADLELLLAKIKDSATQVGCFDALQASFQDLKNYFLLKKFGEQAIAAFPSLKGAFARKKGT